jgi:hypothetical protein
VQQSLAKKVQRQASLVGLPAVLKKVDALPRSKREFAVHKRDRELHLRERSTDVRRHVVRAFVIVGVGRRILRRDAVKIRLQILSSGRCGVFLDHHGAGGVSAKNSQ